ncbi:amino acid adenylation protein [Actinocatenispora thailandica]|uniref:Amino acid adenylation protein n=1 Tax=Actinocatenispora thailandica TaxID=227318 RepID=A0A7R7DSY5_9ACTN|nr:AMP-binding protein [Actinocatenispora thailandica]BCJ37212.1 amino acid adenylation protein [Actinocatenispora thailandica]
MIRLRTRISGGDPTAQEFATRGVRPGALVPVLLPRGPRLAVTLCRILRLGAGYVALDERWPDERVRRVCSMLDAPVVVTDQPWRVERGWCPPELDDLDAGALRVPTPFCAVAPDAVFTAFFTSGSTGEPKGVAATYRALAALLAPGAMPLRLDSATVMTVAAAPPWDAFALELWGPLCNGGSCLLPAGEHLSPGQVREGVARDGLNTVWLTSSLFNLFVEEDLGAFTGLDQVATGGERLSVDHVREFLRAHPGVRLFNGYGPVENCVFSTMHLVSLDDCDLSTGIPIGTPVAGTGVHVLDGDRPCEPGEVGEICLTGDRLSPGYLGNPESTRRAFGSIEVGGKQMRCYRTGDLGWHDERGRFHYHGRLDRQVKIHGHRIEPAEIERHLAEHPAVDQCAVVALSGPGADSVRLVACYRSRDGQVAGAELRAYLHRRLPAYLVPAHWQQLESFPLLGNGKVDTAAVRARAASAVQRPTGTVSGGVAGDAPAAVGPGERRPAVQVPAELRTLVRECTGVDVASPDDSLVDAGADSLALLRLCFRAGHRFGVKVAVDELLARPTTHALAELLDRAAAIGQPPSPAVPAERPLTPTQAAFLVTEAVDAANRQAWHCALVWRITGTVDVAALRRAVGRVHHRHPALHARYPTEPPFARARTVPPTESEFHLLRCQDEQTAAARLDAVLNEPFDLDRGPAWRVVLVTGADRHRALLGLAVHHVAFDGWSEHIVARDLAAAYRAEVAGRSVGTGWYAEQQPWPTATPVDEARLRSLRADLAAELHDTPPFTLPAPPGRPDDSTGLLVRRLDADQTRRCHAVAAARHSTPFVVGLAGYAAAAAELTGADDIPVTVPVVQRDPASQDAVGCLIGLLCLRLRVPPAVARRRWSMPRGARCTAGCVPKPYRSRRRSSVCGRAPTSVVRWFRICSSSSRPNRRCWTCPGAGPS